MSFVVETICSKSPGIALPRINFEMVVKDGPFQRYKTEAEHRQDLEIMRSVPDEELVWFVAALNSRINPQTGQIFEEDREIIETAERVCRALSLQPYHSFKFQDFGRLGVTDEQATERDEDGTRRSSRLVAFTSTIQSDNAPEEVRYRLSLGKPVIAAISNDSLGQRYRDWIVPLIESNPVTSTPSVLVTYDSLLDFARGLRQAIPSF